MQDASLILRASYSFNTVDNLGVVTNTPAAGAVTATGNTGYKEIKNTDEMPRDGGVLEFNALAGSTAGSGADPTAVKIAFTVDYSDDGINSVAQEVSKTWTFTVTSSATPAQFAFMRLRRAKHKYLKVTYTITYTGGTTPAISFAQLGIALVAQESDSARVSTDLS